MQKNQNQSKSNSTITSGKTKIVYTQYYFWQSQNIVLLRRARVSPSFCVRKNSPDRSFSERLSCSKNVNRFSLCDCLKRNTLGVFLFSTIGRTTSERLRYRIADKKKRRLCAFLFITKYNLPVHHNLLPEKFL